MQNLRHLSSNSDLKMWGINPKPAETGQAGTKPVLPATAIHPDFYGSVAYRGTPMAASA
jgi:hypothetical protein